MRSYIRILFIFNLLLISSSVSAQLKSDIGVRFTISDYNRLQLEFRKPISEKYTLRIGASIGQSSGYHFNFVSAANDSVVTMRQQVRWGTYYDLRFGAERNLKWNRFSVHVDLVLAYSRIEQQNWNSYSVLDSFNVWNESSVNPYSLDNFTSQAKEYYFGTGLSLGLSYNFPISDRFILNLNFNQTGLFRFKFAYEETADVLNEFYDGNSTMLEYYTTAGIGLRYVFGKKEKSE